MMATDDSRVTIHMVTSLDGFVARRDGRVDWLETSDEFADGEVLDAAGAEAFVETIDIETSTFTNAHKNRPSTVQRRQARILLTT